MAADITQTREALAVLGALAKGIKDAKADGVINWLDLPKLAPLIVALRAAVDKADQIPAEIKAASADPEAMASLVSEVMTNALALADAILTK